MSTKVEKLSVKNFRSLADLQVETRALNVLFGPNGAGKSTFLDVIWFVRDCANRGVDEASTSRDHGIGLLNDSAKAGDNIIIKLETQLTQYEITVGFSAGRIEFMVGERLYSKQDGICLVDRKIGSDQATFYHTSLDEYLVSTLREPEKLAFTRYLDLEESPPKAATELEKLLRFVNFYYSREIALYRLKKHGSESSYQTWLWDRCQNLWSVLRNLHDRRSVDDRYETIMSFMQKSFPYFQGLFIEQTGPTTVYGNFIEKRRRHPIQASGVSDGHLQMLIHLTALFSEGKERSSIILFDEPETSLHPYALAILAEAIKLATTEWNKQVFLATHSPVLLSQFDPDDILAAEIDKPGEAMITRVSDMEYVQNLLEEYAVGSLYMAEAIAAQSRFEVAGDE